MTTKHDRRSALFVGAAAGASLLAACAAQGRGPAAPAAHAEEEDVSPAEDLMREHGVLNRILLVYEECIRRLELPTEKAPSEQLKASANIVRRFIEDYHEKLEEEFLFPRFEKAGKHVELVDVLRRQHRAGRNLTDQTLRILAGTPSTEGRHQLVLLLRSFIRMYRPHEAREDTVLFPDLPVVIPKKELEELGERFEEKEHALFGKEGFEGIVVQVSAIEQQLGIADLASFTPT